MKCQFSEKFYEILFDHELLMQGDNPQIYVPSQKMENHFGFDTLFADGPKKAIFFQFKTPYTYNESTDKYRFSLLPKNNYKQHNDLCDLNTNAKRIVAVYYAPVFVELNQLRSFSKQGTIKKNSKCFVPLGVNKINTPGPHYVEYDRNKAMMHSDEGVEMKCLSLDELLDSIKAIEYEEFKELFNLSEFVNQKYCCIVFFN